MQSVGNIFILFFSFTAALIIQALSYKTYYSLQNKAENNRVHSTRDTMRKLNTQTYRGGLIHLTLTTQ